MPKPPEPNARSSVRKLHPATRMPADEVMREWTHLERKALKRRVHAPIECVFDGCFHEEDAENTLLGPAPSGTSALPGGSDPNDDSGIDLLRDYSGRTLSNDQERFMFLRFNYCRYRAMRVLQAFRSRQLTEDAAREVLRWETETRATRARIVQLNMPLVLAMAKRTRLTGVDYADLISEGNLALLRSVDKFDCSRGFKFSTYACRAILKSFSRVATRTARYRGYFPVEFDPTLEKSDYLDHQRQDAEGDNVDELKTILGRNLAKLNDVEEQVIRARFALERDVDTEQEKAKTLEQVGEMIGVTKERVRQIQNKALGKLRAALQQSDRLPV